MKGKQYKVLFMGSDAPCYLSDCILHGLYFLDSVSLINIPKSPLMYKDHFNDPYSLYMTYGRGFTIFGTLPKFDEYQSDDIIEKIKNKYFHFVIFSRGTIHNEFSEVIFENYDKKRIIILDGNDSFYVDNNLFGKGIIFKRELVNDHPDVYPIGFGFPKEKIQKPLIKIRKDSIVKPSGRDFQCNANYIYHIEQDYYNDYNQSLFGDTTKKAGWDCLRHYEIMGCRAVPNFINLEYCPPSICTHLPKDLLLDARNLYENFDFDYYQTAKGNEIYHKLENSIFKHFKEHCTTKAVAARMIDIMRKINN